MRKTKSIILLLIGISILFWNCGGPKLTIVKEGVSNYKIVQPLHATPVEEKAALELQNYLEKISVAKLAIVTDDMPFSEFEIIIGRNAHLENADIEVSWDELNEDGFLIQTSGSTLALAGGSGKGTLYAVYGFLEDHYSRSRVRPGTPKSSYNERLPERGSASKKGDLITPHNGRNGLRGGTSPGSSFQKSTFWHFSRRLKRG